MKKIVKVSTVALLIYLSMVFILIYIGGFGPFIMIKKGDIRLYVIQQATTGPSYGLNQKDAKKLKRTIQDIYPDANTSVIELEGNLPSYELDPAEVGNFIIIGKVIGVTNRYEITGDGIVPVIKVAYNSTDLLDNIMFHRYGLIFLYVSMLLLILLPVLLIGYGVIIIMYRKNMKRIKVKV